MALNMAQSQPAAAPETGGVHHSLHNVEGAMNALRSLHQLLVSRFVAIHGSSACDTLLTETNKLRHDILHEMELLQSAPSSSAPRRRSPHQEYDGDDEEERFLAEEEEQEDDEHDEGVEYDPDDLAETMEGKGKFFAPPLPPALVAMIPRRMIAAPTHHTSLLGGESAAAVVCAVCQEDLGEGHVLLTLPVCNHEFCEVCAVEWLAICGSCPSCRRVIEPEDVTLLMEANCVLSARGGDRGDMDDDDDDDEHAVEPDDLTGNNGSAAANRTLSQQQTPPPSTTKNQPSAVTVKEVQLHTEQQLQLSKAAQALLQSRANPSMATPVVAAAVSGGDGLQLRARPGSGGGRPTDNNASMTVPPPSSLYSRTQPPPLMMSISSIRSASTATGATSAVTGGSTTMTTESAAASRFQSSSSSTTVTGAAGSGSASSPQRREGQTSNSGLQLSRVAAQRRPQSAASSSLHGAAPMMTASFLMQGRQVERPSSALPSKNHSTGEAAKSVAPSSSEEGSSVVPPLHESHKAMDSAKERTPVGVPSNNNNNSRGPLHTRPMSAPTRSATTSPVPMSSSSGDALSSSSHPLNSLKPKSTSSLTTWASRGAATEGDEITVPTTVPSATSGGNFAKTQVNEDERADGMSSSQQAPLPRPQQQRPASSGALRVAAVRTVATFQGWDSAKPQPLQPPPHTRLLQPSDATLCSTASIMHRFNSAVVTSVGGRPSTAGSGTHHPSYSSSSSFVTRITNGADPRPLNHHPFPFSGGGSVGGHNVGSSASSTVAALLRPSSSSTSLWTTPFASNVNQTSTITTLSHQNGNNCADDGGDGGAVTIGSTRWSPVAARIQAQRSTQRGTNDDNLLSPSAAGTGGSSNSRGGSTREEEVLRFSILGPRVPKSGGGGVSSQSLLTRPSSSPSLRVAVGIGGRLNSNKKSHANTQPPPPPPPYPTPSSAAISLRGAAASGNGAGLLCVDGKSWERQKFKKTL